MRVAAHEATCEAGTVAVMAGGIDLIYPAENRALADRILVMSERPGRIVEEIVLDLPSRDEPAARRRVWPTMLGALALQWLG